ncbi:hybrid sensor histidine kinase/response regulator [Paenibacillus agricola]|uniref:histidine kinase n=1 Tax=Paenibacillus agricola TaxID=2716264 RepID=A0ABX0J6K6_9BACL|nr:ATP-binding protein [Paenibacillus agricola]NHN31772.1 response regulator [Paenibacillus agricola]
MKTYWLTLLAGVICVTLLPLYGVFHSVNSLRDNPNAVAGWIDLRDRPLEGNAPIRLSGEWEFYRNQLLTPQDFAAATGPVIAATGGSVPDRAEIVQIPGQWNGYLNDIDSAQAHGTGTYRLRLQLPDLEQAVYGIRTVNIRMAHKLFLNGRELGASGIPGLTAGETVPNNVPYVRFAAVSGDTVEIVVQVANFSYSSGGMIFPILFGDQESILANRTSNVFGYLTTSAGFLILSLYFLLLIPLRRREVSLLYLGAFCLACLVFVLTHGEKMILSALPFISYELVLKVQLFSSTLVYYFLIRYVFCLFPKFHHRVLLLWLKGIVLLFCMAAVFLPASVFSRLEDVCFLFAFISMLWVMYVLVKETQLRSDNSLALIVSIQSIMIMLLINLLHAFGLLEDQVLVPYEMLIFMLAQTLVLSKRFSALFMEVELLSRKLVRLDEMKDEFMANTSHELRTPLHGMINMAQSLVEGAAGGLNEKQARHLSMIVSTGNRLTFLINDILDFNKLKNGQIELQRRQVDLPAVVHSVLEVIVHLANEQDLRIRQQWPERLPLLDADEDRLRQILYNILGNAVKFTEQGTITLSAETSGDEVTISIEDTGIGIAEARLPNLFQAYEGQSAGFDRSYTGTGLGLSITKQLVELSGGRVGVESVLGRGSRFFFTLPAVPHTSVMAGEAERQIAAAAATQPVGVLAEAGDGQPMNKGVVLVVDDDPVNLQVLINLLTLEHYEVVAVKSGTSALDRLNSMPQIDLVITDWMMPEMSGLELCQLIRSRYMLSELPVLMLTARSRPEEIVAGFRAGVNDFLTKPVDAGELRARVRTLIELQSSIRTLVHTEMAFLQAQIKPHFLYNALNTIIAVCYYDADKTIQLLLELSHFLRSSFEVGNLDRLVTLQKELELVHSYLSLEKARFDERLQVEYDITENGFLMVPPLSIQPIVENAVRHGVMQREDGGTILIRVTEQQGVVQVTVSDDGVGMPESKLKSILTERSSDGVGLMNIHKRLLMQYGKGLQINSEWQQGTTVSFEVPMLQPAREAVVRKESALDEGDFD